MSRSILAPLRAVLAGAVVACGLMTTPAVAQDGMLLRQIFGQIGILPAEKDPIDYNERPGLVVPKDTTRLRSPEESDPARRNAAWPNDPDLEARRKAEAARNAPSAELLSGRRTIDGARVSNEEIARSRTARGTTPHDPKFTQNDHAGVRVSPEEWSKISRTSDTASTITPGVEPPRQYLTDPPKGLRMPAAGAPIKRTNDGPAEGLIAGNDRPKSVYTE